MQNGLPSPRCSKLKAWALPRRESACRSLDGGEARVARKKSERLFSYKYKHFASPGEHHLSVFLSFHALERTVH